MIISSGATTMMSALTVSIDRKLGDEAAISSLMGEIKPGTSPQAGTGVVNTAR